MLMMWLIDRRRLCKEQKKAVQIVGWGGLLYDCCLRRGGSVPALLRLEVVLLTAVSLPTT